ncbi:MAG: MFS transporter [Thermoflavifilum sp.]|nr:MFS transporter [Thermoflavifilum sp.]MCL6515114.1 MFS transporter [Alicyclobacillus sp.]
MKSRTWVLAGSVIAMLIASLDSTVMNTAMPYIARVLGDFTLYAWVFGAYMIVSTVTAPLYGKLADIFGRKRVFIASILIFLVGSALCGTAHSMLALILFRALQGLGAGGIMPLAQTIAGDLFRVEDRGKIQALFTGMWGLSSVLGPLVGATFVTWASWRWIFYVNVPLCILAVLLLLQYRDMYPPRQVAVDAIGAALFTVGVGVLLADTVVTSRLWMYAVVGISLLAAFVLYERRQTQPFIPFSLLRTRGMTSIILNTFVACAALFGASSYVPLFLQEVAGQSLFVSGLVLIGSSAGWMISAVPAGKWVVRSGFRVPLLVGNAVLFLAALVYLPISAHTGFWYLFGAMVVQGYAFGLLLTVALIACQQLVQPDQRGLSTSLQMFARNLGSAIGVTVMGAFLTHAPSVLMGMHRLFLYALAASVLAVVTALCIPRLGMPSSPQSPSVPRSQPQASGAGSS